MPFAADPGTGAWYLPTWLPLLLLPLYAAVRAILWGHLLWAALGTYLFLRRVVGVSPVPAWIGSGRLRPHHLAPRPGRDAGGAGRDRLAALGAAAGDGALRTGGVPWPWIALLALLAAPQALAGWPAGAYLTWLIAGRAASLLRPWRDLAGGGCLRLAGGAGLAAAAGRRAAGAGGRAGGGDELRRDAGGAAGGPGRLPHPPLLVPPGGGRRGPGEQPALPGDDAPAAGPGRAALPATGAWCSSSAPWPWSPSCSPSGRTARSSPPSTTGCPASASSTSPPGWGSWPASPWPSWPPWGPSASLSPGWRGRQVALVAALAGGARAARPAAVLALGGVRRLPAPADQRGALRRGTLPDPRAGGALPRLRPPGPGRAPGGHLAARRASAGRCWCS